MADTKISALTVATTPLAGTEVLPIVQSGVTKQVSVADLTAGRAVSAASLTLTGTPLGVASGGTGLATLTANYIPYGNGTSALQSSSNFTYNGTKQTITSTGANTNQLYLAQAAATVNLVALQIGGSTTRSNGLQVSNTSGLLYAGVEGQYGGGSADYFASGDSGYDAVLAFASGKGLSIGTYNGTVALRIATDDITVRTGNLVQGTAAKGINFTANTPAAGMTSQLLNWYEAGTWTPSFASTSGSITSMTSVSGVYTRVGNLVHVTGQGKISNNGTGSGAIVVTGFPFTISSAMARYPGSGSEVDVVGFALLVFAKQSDGKIYLEKVDGTYPGANNHNLIFNVTYQV